MARTWLLLPWLATFITATVSLEIVLPATSERHPPQLEEITTWLDTHTHTHTPMHKHTHMHKHTCTNTHMYTQTHTHTYTHAATLGLLLVNTQSTCTLKPQVQKKTTTTTNYNNTCAHHASTIYNTDINTIPLHITTTLQNWIQGLGWRGGRRGRGGERGGRCGQLN